MWTKPSLRRICVKSGPPLNGVLIFLALLIHLAGPSTVGSQNVDNLILMTEQFPPFNYEADGELKGISVDLLERILEKIGSKLTKKDIRLLPWARGYRDALEQKNTVLFITNRNKKRENLFKWVGPVITTEFGLIAKKDRGIRVSSHDDIHQFKIGVISKDYGELLLQTLGVDPANIEPVATGELNVLKLNRHRIDLWNYEVTVAAWIISQAGFNPSDYEVVFMLKQDIGAYFAFHKDTDDAVIAIFQGALNKLKVKEAGKAHSDFELIVNRYIQGSISPLK